MQRGGDAEDAQPTHVWTLGLRFETGCLQGGKSLPANCRSAAAQGMCRMLEPRVSRGESAISNW